MKCSGVSCVVCGHALLRNIMHTVGAKWLLFKVHVTVPADLL